MSSGVEVRRYTNSTMFQNDAGVMAAAGWKVVAQSSAKDSRVGRAIGLGLLALVLGVVLLGGIGVIIAIIVVIAVAAGGQPVYTVTYQYAPPAG